MQPFYNPLYDPFKPPLMSFMVFLQSKQTPIVSLKILPSENFVATGQFNGALTIFKYGKEKDGEYKVCNGDLDIHNSKKVPASCKGLLCLGCVSVVIS